MNGLVYTAKCKLKEFYINYWLRKWRGNISLSIVHYKFVDS